MEWVMSFYLACMIEWIITAGDMAGPGGEPQVRRVGGYEILQLHGPFRTREEAEAATCTDVGAERAVVQATDAEEVPARLLEALPR